VYFVTNCTAAAALRQIEIRVNWMDSDRDLAIVLAIVLWL